MTRLAPIEAPVDENSREPDFERPFFAIRRDVAEHLDEGVLHGFVRVRRIAKILVSNSNGAALVDRNERAETISRVLELPALDEPSNLDCEARIVGHLRRSRPSTARRRAANDGRGVGIPVVSSASAVLEWPQINTHEGITICFGDLFTVYRRCHNC